MQVLDLLLDTEQAIDALCIGELDLIGVAGPVIAAGDQHHRPWCGECGDLGIVGVVKSADMDRMTALALAATEEMRRHHHHRHRNGDPVVDGGQQKALGAAAR